MTDRWYDKTVSQVEEKLHTDSIRGLSQKEAVQRVKKKGENLIFIIPKSSFIEYLKHITTDFTSILLIITALISLIFEHKISSAVIIATLVIYYMWSIWAYVKAQRVLEGMGRFSLPSAKVIRDGRLYLTGSEQLAEGDVIILSAGDIVPCDARLVDTSNLYALEVNLTSETRLSKKDEKFLQYTRDLPPSYQKNMVFASTIITKGTGRAIVCSTGDETLVTKLQKNIPIVSHNKLKVIKILKRYSAVWSLVMIVVIFLLTALSLLSGYGSSNLLDIFMNALALAVSVMSEMYVAFAYIIIGSGVYSTLKQYKNVNTGAVIKNIEKLDSLKGITAILINKEGALTLSSIYADRIFACGRDYKINEGEMNEQAARTLRYALLSTGLYSENQLSVKNIDYIYDPEQESIIKCAKKFNIYGKSLSDEFVLCDHAYKSDDSRFDTALLKHGNAYEVAVRGEIDEILSCCTNWYSDDGIVPLTQDQKRQFKVSAYMMNKEGYRVIGVSSKKVVYTNLSRIAVCQNGMIFEGFVSLAEPLLPGAAKNIQKCREAGIKVIMMTESSGYNNIAVAETAGIVKNESEVISANEISSMRDGLFRANAGVYRLYMGLNIHQKRTLLNNLRKNGEKVAVYARELDEIILLKEADIGIIKSTTISKHAQNKRVEIKGGDNTLFARNSKESGISGAEAMKFASDVIISEADNDGNGGFNSIVSAIKNAKNIFRNMERMIRYLMASQFAKIFIVFFSVLTGNDVMTSLQILFCGLIIDFASVGVIAFERPEPDELSNKINYTELISKRFRFHLNYILFGVIWAILTVFAPRFLAFIGVTSISEVISGMFISFALTQLIMLAECIKDKSVFAPSKANGAYILLCICVVLFFALCLIFPGAIGMLFAVERISIPTAMTAAGIPLIMLLIIETYKMIKKI